MIDVVVSYGVDVETSGVTPHGPVAEIGFGSALVQVAEAHTR
jgi:hypothetical protein